MPLPEHPLTGDHTTLTELFDTVVDQAGEVEAFVDGDRRLTFAEWGRAADGVATRLASMGVGAGDVVGIRLPSSIDYAIAYQAAIRLGAITSGMNPRLGVAETDHILAKSTPRVVVTDDDLAGVARLSLAELAEATGDVPFTARPASTDTDPVAIVWTSGTTGKPKGAVFDHACMRAMARAAGPLSQVGDRRISPLPFAHVGYMTRVWDELVHVITTIITPSPWTPADAIRLLSDERVTVGQGVPAQWQMILAHPDLAAADTSALRVVSTGAARVPPEMVAAMHETFGCPVVVRYTSTEACVSTGTAIDDPDEVVCNSVGTPGAGVELELRAEEGRGEVVAGGEVGTVCLRSRAVMRGYWLEPELTAAAIDPDGWLLTGDLGFLDERGDLHLAGRSTEMYIRGGYNIYPAEIENCMGGHAQVDRVAVVGTPAPVLGEIGVAFVVPADRGRAAHARRAAGLVQGEPRRLQGARLPGAGRRAPAHRHVQDRQAGAGARGRRGREGLGTLTGLRSHQRGEATPMGICDGRVVVITGAGRGLGRAHALAFAAEGAKVVVNDLGASLQGEGIDLSPAQEVVNEIVAHGGEAIVNGDDISDWDGAGALVQSAIDTFGGLDTVVTNAGIVRDRMFVNMTVDDWDAVIKVAPARHLLPGEAGRRVLAGRVQGRQPASPAGWSPPRRAPGSWAPSPRPTTSAAKAGIAALTINIATELGRIGVTANSIAPSARSRMTEDAFAEMMARSESGFDAMDPANISPIVVWLGSEQSGHVPGRVFECAGGELSVADGWQHGTPVDKGARWDPAELGSVVDQLIADALRPPPRSTAPRYGAGGGRRRGRADGRRRRRRDRRPRRSVGAPSRRGAASSTPPPRCCARRARST